MVHLPFSICLEVILKIVLSITYLNQPDPGALPLQAELAGEESTLKCLGDSTITSWTWWQATNNNK